MAKRATRRKTAGTGAAKRSGKATGSAAKGSGQASRSAAKRSAAKRTATKRPPTKRTATKRARRTTAATPSTSGSKKGAARTASSAKTRPAAKRRLPKGSDSSSSLVTTVKGAVAGAVAAVADSLPWSSAEPDAIELLEADHRLMQDLLSQGVETTTRGVKTRTALLARVERELKAHELVEEKLLYPALQSHPQAKDIVLEGYQEHHVADVLLGELKGLARDAEQWGAKFKVLKESIDHHIEEEEGEMFRTARGIFSRAELRQLGGQMAKMKSDALGS